MKHKLIVLALIFSLVFVSQNTFSLGMGKIQVNSALDEQLNASIDIIANNDESIDQVSVKLASAADYKKVGLDKSFVPGHIMVSVDEDNPYQINVTSNGPVSEPIVSLLLDVTWANGRILREFTLLLDPPSYQASTRGSISIPASQPEPQQPETMADVEDDAVTAQSDDIPPVSQDLNKAYEEMETDVSAPEQDEAEFAVETPMDENVSETLPVMPGEVYVNAGDTLWRIANQNKPSDVTTHQMMMAIYENNPNAFLNNNINQMVKGSTLQMPDPDSSDYLSYQEALAAFESHNSRWATNDDSYSSFQTESQVDDDADMAESTDYGVQLSGGEGDDSDSQQTEGDIADSGNSGLSDEEAFNASSENEELKSRVSELESIVDEQQSALTLQDDDMANLENQMADNSADDTLNEGGFDSSAEADDEATGEDTSVADDVWGTDVSDDMAEQTDDSALMEDDGGQLLADDSSEQDDMISEDDSTSLDDSTEADAADQQTVVTTPKKPVPVSEPWYTSAINWIQQNVLWVIIGLVVLFLIILLPRLFNRGDDDPAEGSSFLDDIKSSRGKKDQGQEEIDEEIMDEDQETVLTTPVSVDGDDDSLADDDDDLFGDDTAEDSTDDDSDDDDVLAELDNSLAFDDSDDDDSDDDFDFDFDDDEPSDSEETSDKDSADDLSYETPTKEYDPAPFRDDDSFEDDFDLSDLDGDSDDDSDDEAQDELESDTDDSSVFDDDDFDLEDELTELDEGHAVTEIDSDEEQSDDGQDDDDDDDDDDHDDDDDDDFSDDDFLADLDEIDGLDDSDDDSNDDQADDEDLSSELDDDFEESLSLDEDDQTTTFETEQADDEMDEDIDLGLDDLMDDGDVIETKLDLAKAYIEMGDTEGAKNLLDEVKAEGNEAQQSEADKLLDDM